MRGVSGSITKLRQHCFQYMIQRMAVEFLPSALLQKLVAPVSPAETGCHQNQADFLHILIESGRAGIALHISDLCLRELISQRTDIEFFRDLPQHLLCDSSRGVLIPDRLQPLRVKTLADCPDFSAKRVPAHYDHDLVRVFRYDRFAFRRDFHRHAVTAVSFHKDTVIVLTQLPEDFRRQR